MNANSIAATPPSSRPSLRLRPRNLALLSRREKNRLVMVCLLAGIAQKGSVWNATDEISARLPSARLPKAWFQEGQQHRVGSARADDDDLARPGLPEAPACRVEIAGMIGAPTAAPQRPGKSGHRPGAALAVRGDDQEFADPVAKLRRGGRRCRIERARLTSQDGAACLEDGLVHQWFVQRIRASSIVPSISMKNGTAISANSTAATPVLVATEPLQQAAHATRRPFCLDHIGAWVEIR